MLKTSNFVSKGFSILCSLGERQIFLKITDQVNFAQYEAAFDSKEVRLNFDLLAIYEILCRAFDSKEGYEFSFHIAGSGTMKLLVRSLINGFLKVDFDLLLREKVLSNDGELTTVVNRLEQQIVALKKDTEDKLKNLIEENVEIKEQNKRLLCSIGNVPIIITLRYCTHQGQPLKVSESCFKPMSSTSLELRNQNHNTGDWTMEKIIFQHIKCFFGLKKLSISHHYDHKNLTFMQNELLEDLTLALSGDGHNNPFVSIVGIDGFPNLKKLSITGAPCLKDIPTVLKSLQHQIKEINISNCPQVNSIELQTYCQTNGIKLAIA